MSLPGPELGLHDWLGHSPERSPEGSGFFRGL